MAEDEEIEKINRKKLEEILSRKIEKRFDAPVTLTDANFASQVSSSRGVTVVDFWAPWCGPCRMVGPVIEELAKEYSGRVTFGKLNVDENPVTAQTFGVQSIPTILVFNNGKAVDGLLGAVPKSHIESKFRPYLSGRGDSLYG